MAATTSLSAAPALDQIEFFEKRIRPLLAERCYECHSADRKQKGNLLLDSREGTLKGGDTAPAVAPGDPEKSLLIKAVRYTDKDLRMPPKDKKLTDAQIADLVAWVKMGAPDPRHKEARTTGAKEAKAKTWWAFQPVREPTVPGANRQNPIDAFVGEKLAAARLGKAPPADSRSLLRRATFDMTGLPPTPEEIDAFVADGSDRAYEAVVERLLNSLAYGQRWARHWLDIVRYADYYNPVPKERKEIWELTEAWRYRDWVVDAFNRDLPFDQFIVHQIAGDRLRSPSGKEIYPEGLIATTFLSNGAWDFGDDDKEKIVSDMVDDNIGVIGNAFLGLTLDCARCHDHKFDPISTEDYYGLAGMFYSSHMLKALGAKGAEYTINRVSLLGPAAPAKRVEQEKRLAEIKAKLVELDKQPQAHIDAARRGEMNSSRCATACKRSRPIRHRSRWLSSMGALPADSFRASRTFPSTSAAVTRNSAPWCRDACRDSSPAKISRRSPTGADGWNWRPGWHRAATR